MFYVVLSRRFLAWQVFLGVGSLAWGVVLPANANPPNFVTPAAAQLAQAPTVPPQQLQANAEAFVDALFSQKYDQAWQYLAPDAQAENPPAVLEKKREIFVKRTGDFHHRVSSRADGLVIVVNVAFSKLTDDLIVIMEPGGKIMGVDFPAAPNDASAQPPS